MTDSLKIRPPSHTHWFILHIGVPLLPFIAGIFIHYISVQRLFPDYSDLALSISAVSLFIRNGILDSKIHYPKEMREARERFESEKNAYAMSCFFVAALFFILFVIIENSESKSIAFHNQQDNVSLQYAYAFTSILTSIALILFNSYGRKFRLKVRFR